MNLKARYIPGDKASSALRSLVEEFVRTYFHCESQDTDDALYVLNTDGGPVAAVNPYHRYVIVEGTVPEADADDYAIYAVLRDLEELNCYVNQLEISC